MEEIEVKSFRRRVYDKTKTSVLKVKKEFKKQMTTAITAAFAFLIALSWREPIKNLVDSLIVKIGLGDKLIYFQFLSAIAITLLAVLALMLISRWASKS